MKKILIYTFTALAAAAALASCDKNEYPVFDDKNAFVAFDDVAVTADEDYSADGDTLRVAVTMASVEGLEETVKFEITEPETKAAKAGVNYELLTTSGTLSFDADHRTAYIEFKTIYDGVYTGDLSFNIKLYGNDEIAAGSEDECTVTIGDIDHPLSSILGAYTMSGTSYWYGAMSWTMTTYKDNDDDHKIWFHNLMGNSSWALKTTRYYGTVDQDLTTITIPFGQDSEYKYGGSTPITLYGIDSDLQDYDTGSVQAKIINDNGKITIDFGKNYGFWFYINGAGSISIMLPGLSAVKN